MALGTGKDCSRNPDCDLITRLLALDRASSFSKSQSIRQRIMMDVMCILPLILDKGL